MGTETVVVQVKVLEGYVRSEESDEGRLRVQAESVVVQVDRVEVWQVEDGGQEVRDGVGDLAQEAAGEDVGEVRDLSPS